MSDVPLQPDAPKPNPHAQIEVRLASIEQKLDTITANQQKALPAVEPDKTDPTNKPLLALAFGFTGFKLGFFALGKVGLIADLARGIQKKGFSAGFKEVFGALFTLGSNTKEPQQILKYSIITAGAGSVAGAIGGAWIGWTRGDRIKNLSELFTHPIDSMKKIFAKAPPKAEAAKEATVPAGATAEAPAPAPAPDAAGTVAVAAQHEGKVAAPVLQVAH